MSLARYLSKLGAMLGSDGKVPQAALAANVASNGPAFHYYQQTQQSGISQSVSTKVNFQTAVYDTTGGMFSNSRFQPTIEGWYFISTAIQSPNPGPNCSVSVAINRNGNEYFNGSSNPGTTILWAVSVASKHNRTASSSNATCAAQVTCGSEATIEINPIDRWL